MRPPTMACSGGATGGAGNDILAGGLDHATLAGGNGNDACSAKETFVPSLALIVINLPAATAIWQTLQEAHALIDNAHILLDLSPPLSFPPQASENDAPMGKIEHGEHMPALILILRISGALDRSAGELLLETEARLQHNEHDEPKD